MGVETFKFHYEGGIADNNCQYLITAKQKSMPSKVMVVIENLDDSRDRFGKEFENIFEFIEWLKGK